MNPYIQRRKNLRRIREAEETRELSEAMQRQGEPASVEKSEYSALRYEVDQDFKRPENQPRLLRTGTGAELKK